MGTVQNRVSSKSTLKLVGDFETTVDYNTTEQTHTEVWASALVEIGTEDVIILTSINETFKYLLNLNRNIIIYYHNLKFDGSFWLDFLLKSGLKQAISGEGMDIVFDKPNEMPEWSFKYDISDMGLWYSIVIKTDSHFIEIRDSLKLLPFSVKEIGKGFATKHKKLELEYKGERHAGGYISPEEKEYIANDVLVVKEALEIMFEEGNNRLTIGSCCLSEFKAIERKKDPSSKYDDKFPDLTDISAPEYTGYQNTDDYVRNSYHGGWCYLVKGKENKIYKNGITADVNSLYPSVMSSESGCIYPTGYPHYFKDEFPDIITKRETFVPADKIEKNPIYYFVRFSCRFKLKEGYLPFVQIKHSFLYKATECLETSDYLNPFDHKYYRYYYRNGEKIDTRVTLTMTMTDFELFKEHYDILDFKLLDGVWFNAEIGIFDDYISKYRKIKMESKGAKRTLAKLFLNNLYGKMATSPKSDYKYAYLDTEKNKVSFINIVGNPKKAGYIPIGSAITSYARNFTIRAAQKNFHGKDQRGFIYADTDSIHCDLNENELIDVPVHPTEFCHWKLEACWDEAIFVRQKTYIEHVTHEDMVPIKEPYNNIKCAGMPDRCKYLLNCSLLGIKPGKYRTEDEKIFIEDDGGNVIKRTYKDFRSGLIVPSKLMPRRIDGGIVLTDSFYEMR